MENCLFCKIVRGESPCYKIYENNKALAFLNINPLARGHSLVIPKDHFKNLFEIKPEDLKEVILAVQETAKILKEKLNPTGINLLQRNGRGAGQEISHLHFHILPRFENDTLRLPPESQYIEEDIESLHKLLTK